MVSPYNTHYIIIVYNKYGNIDTKTKEYLTALDDGMTHIVSRKCSGEEIKTVIKILRSEYSRYNNIVMWKTGIFGKRYIDIHIGEKTLRVTFKNRKNGTYVTYVESINKRAKIPAFFNYCNYCRVGLAPMNIMTCSECSIGYCGKHCQAMDWVSYHSYNCPGSE